MMEAFIQTGNSNKSFCYSKSSFSWFYPDLACVAGVNFQGVGGDKFPFPFHENTSATQANADVTLHLKAFPRPILMDISKEVKLKLQNEINSKTSTSLCTIMHCIN